MDTSKYVRIRLIGESGSYIQRIDELLQALDGEVDDIRAGIVGTKIGIELEVVEMTDDEFAALPEFEGW